VVYASRVSIIGQQDLSTV